MQKPTLEELRSLSVQDRLQLLEDVWASLDEEQDRLPMPGWHGEELKRRLQSFEDNRMAVLLGLRLRSVCSNAAEGEACYPPGGGTRSRGGIRLVFAAWGSP
jgi:putative addiction module component (TIGR02574 family)